MTQVLAWADYVVWLDGPEGPGDRFFQMFDNQYRTNSKKPLLTTYDVAECARVFSETKELPVSQAQLKGLLTGHNVYHGGCAIVAFDPPAPEPAGNAAYHAAVKKWWKDQGVVALRVGLQGKAASSGSKSISEKEATGLVLGQGNCIIIAGSDWWRVGGAAAAFPAAVRSNDVERAVACISIVSIFLGSSKFTYCISGVTVHLGPEAVNKARH